MTENELVETMVRDGCPCKTIDGRCQGALDPYPSECDENCQLKREVFVQLVSKDYRKAKRGEWVKSQIPGEKYNCSVCGGAAWYYDAFGDVCKSNFCPNCGADMRGGE